MEIRKQISLFMANQPGNLSNICAVLEENGIDIEGIATSDAVDHAVVRLIVTDPDKAVHLFGEMGMIVIECEVLDVPLDPRPGALKRISDKLLNNHINIDYIYGAQSDSGKVFLKVDNAKKAMDVL
jgi:hypothetical protein